MNLILSPHFDDAVLSLGGLLAKEEHNSVVATFFAGVPPLALVRSWDQSSGFKDSTEAMRERVLEDKRALTFLGVKDSHIRTYSHLDFQYRRQKKGEPILPEPELYALIQQEINSLIREFGSSPLKIFAPSLEIGKIHPDHLLVKHAALAATRALPAESAVELRLYQDLPYAMSIMDAAYPRSASNLFMRKGAGRRDYSLLERNVANTSLKITPITIPLEDADMKKKLAGAALYTSQVGTLGKHLLKRIKSFSAGQSRALSLSSPYCEVVYKVD